MLESGRRIRRPKHQRFGLRQHADAKSHASFNFGNEKIAENRHLGIPVIRDEARTHGVRQPEFIDQRGSFLVRFFNSSAETNASDHDATPGQDKNSPRPADVEKYYSCVLRRTAIGVGNRKSCRPKPAIYATRVHSADGRGRETVIDAPGQAQEQVPAVSSDQCCIRIANFCRAKSRS